MSGYGDAALKVQVSSPLSAMLDWQKMQQGIAQTGQTTAQTGLLGQQTQGAALDNQSKALMLGIRGQLLGATGPGGGQAPAGMPGAGQGGSQSYAPGFGDAGPTAVSTPFGVPIPRTAYLSAMMSPDPMKSVVESYNMGRQVIAQTLTQAGDPATDPSARTRVQQAAQSLYANGWIGTDGYLQLVKDPAKAKVFIDATMSPDTHVARANSLAGMGARVDKDGQVTTDPGAVGAHAAKRGAEAEAGVGPALETTAGNEAIKAPYGRPEQVTEQVRNADGSPKVDEHGEPVMRTRYIQPGVPTGPTAMPGAAGAVAAGNAAAGVGAPGPTLRGPGGSTVSPNAGGGGNPLLGGIAGDPGSVASVELPAAAPTQPTGRAAPPPPPLPPLPAGGAAQAAPAAGGAAPTPTLGGMPAPTPTQQAAIETQKAIATDAGRKNIDQVTDYQNAALDKAQTAQRMNNLIDQGRIESQGWTSGTFADHKMGALKFWDTIRQNLNSVAGKDILGKPDESVGSWEAFNKNMLANVSSVVREVTPRAAVQEFMTLQKAQPQDTTSPQGTRQLFDEMQGINDWLQAKSSAAGRLNKATGSTNEFDNNWNQTITPMAFVFHRMNVPDFQVAASHLSQTTEGRDLLKTAGEQMKFLQDQGIFSTLNQGLPTGTRR